MRFASAPLAPPALGRGRTHGIDVGDHPPITPVRMGTPKQCDGEVGWALYQYICRHFVASLSTDAIFETATVQAALGGGLTVEASATRCVERGWTDALHVAVVGDVDDEAARAKYAALAALRSGDEIGVVRPAFAEIAHTLPPPQHSPS